MMRRRQFGSRRTGVGAGKAGGMTAGAAALVLAAAACGSSGGGPGGGGGATISFHGILKISGAVTVSESFTDNSAIHDGVPNCTSAAADGDSASQPNLWQAPSPPQGSDVTVNVSPTANDYHGAGTYPDALLSGGDGVIEVNGTAYDLTSYVAQESMTVKSDGSGSLTFSNVPTATMSNAVPDDWTGGISGSLTWTCSN